MADELRNSIGMLMQVEVPIRVSLGRTRIRMKDLLALSHGSVVELDQQVGDEVEIRVNNCVLAVGEVVNVEGNYGVRISRMAAGDAELLEGDT
jgi:flagellar motor switch protein FliN/FliY